MRMFILVRGKFYYDIGLRREDTLLSKEHFQFGEKCPRFLEDFIDVYGNEVVKVLDYGSLSEDKEYIDELLR